MIEKLVPIKLPPGLMANGTIYDAKGRWRDGRGIRWVDGLPRAIGQSTVAVNGSGFTLAQLSATTTASVMIFNSTNGERIVVGTDNGLYANDSTGGGTGNWTTITPVGFASSPAFNRWEFQVFGGKLIAAYGGKVWEWAGVLASLPTNISAPPALEFVGNIVCTPERFLVYLGPNSDKTKIQWADQESTTVWTPATTNQAGDINLNTIGEVICGRATKGQTMIHTTTDLWSMTYVGGNDIYSFRQEGNNCGIISPGASVVVDGRVYWMGLRGFFMYDGFVRPIRCDIADKIWGELSSNAFNTMAKYNPIQAFSLSQFNEIWFCYPSTGTTPDRQAVYNYKDDYWTYHQLDRIGGLDAGVFRYPHMFTSTGFLRKHEVAEGGSSTDYLESGPFEIGEGDQVMRVQRVVPDGQSAATDSTMILFSSMYPTATETQSATISLANPTSVRQTGRQFRVRIRGNGIGWRVGVPRLGVIPQGKR